MIADKLVHSICKILQELKNIKETGVTAAELKIAKEMYKGSVLMGLENTMSFAFRLCSYALLYNKKYSVNEIIAQIERVKLEDLSRLAQDIFQNQKLKLVVFSPADLKVSRQSLLPVLEI